MRTSSNWSRVAMDCGSRRAVTHVNRHFREKSRLDDQRTLAQRTSSRKRAAICAARSPKGLREEITGAIVEDDQQLVKFHGMYLQDDRDLRAERQRKKMEKAFAFMIRVRIPGGVLTPAQWLALDEIARDLCQRHDAPHDAPDHPVPRRHQVEPQGDDGAHRRRAPHHHRRLRRRQPQRDLQPESAPVARARRGARARARDLRPSPAAARRPIARSGSTARRSRAARRRRGRADLRQHLSAAQVQDRGRGAAVERRRRLRPRPRLHRDPRQEGQHRRLQRHASAAAWA